MRKNRIIFLCGIIIILLIIASILIINSLKPKSKEPENVFNNEVRTVEENTIIPQNSYMFFGKYINGCMDSKTIYEKISKFYTNTFPFYYTEIVNKNNTEVEKYYNDNRDKINNDLQISNLDDFKNYYNTFKKLNGNNLEVEYLEFIENAIQKNKDDTTASFKVKYKNNTEFNMCIKAYISNQQNGENLIIYFQK